jgi:hypothetical protein
VQLTLPFVTERRRSKRYIISGQISFQGPSFEASGELLNIGHGGATVRSATKLDPGREWALRCTIPGYAGCFKAAGEVVGAQSGVFAIRFLKEPPELLALLQWLENENCAWTIMNAARDPDVADPPRFSPSKLSASPADEQEQELLLTFLHELG